MTNTVRDLVLEMLKRPTARDQQKLIGPSSLGDPCDFCLAAELLLGASDEDVEPDERPYWLGAVLGTAVHMFLEDRANTGNVDCRAEARVRIGEIPGYGVITGSTDLYLPKSGIVIDYKGLALDTPLPTPNGWTTMGTVQVGDYLLGNNGAPTEVIGKSNIKNLVCYELTFSDGEKIVCDEDHLWTVHLGEASKKTTLSAKELFDRGVRGPGRGQRDVRVLNHQSLDLPVADLPIDPYVLGAWLGDGHSSSGRITKPLDGLWDEIARRGYRVSGNHARNCNRAETRTIYGLHTTLSQYGLLGNKHIPMVYLRASHSQRLDLLRGLMDTDGYYNPIRKRVVMTTTSETQAEYTAELVRTFGWTVIVHPHMTTWQGGTKQAYTVEFTPQGENVFLVRNQDTGYTKATGRGSRRLITEIKQVASVPTQCVMVDSEDSLYLCGKNMVTTHNTTSREKLKQLKLAFETKYTVRDPEPLLRARFTAKKYVGQGMTYGWGWEQAGYKVEKVAFAFICRDGLTDNDVWVKELDYDRAYAEQVWARANKIWLALQGGRSLESFLSKSGCYSCMTTQEPRKFSKKPF